MELLKEPMVTAFHNVEPAKVVAKLLGYFDFS
jgi:hypothetical protein